MFSSNSPVVASANDAGSFHSESQALVPQRSLNHLRYLNYLNDKNGFFDIFAPEILFQHSAPALIPAHEGFP